MANEYCIVGLGNPGDEYENTRHNIGFDVLDYLAASESKGKASWTSKYKGLYTAISFGEKRAHLLKPQTYMNRSGVSVQELVHFFKVLLPDVLIVHDELDLDFGGKKFSLNGSDAGNNGVKSVYQHIGKDVWRLRLGVGKPPAGRDGADWVLSKFKGAEASQKEDLIAEACNAVRMFVVEGPQNAQNKYNRKPGSKA